MPETVYEKAAKYDFFSLTRHVLIASGAALSAEFIYYPFVTIWTMQHAQQLSFRAACNQIKKGKGFYTGFSVSLASAVPYALLYLLGKDLPLLFGDNNFVQMLRGLTGQGLATLVYEPAAKMMMLTQAASNADMADNFSKLSLFRKAREIRQKQGIRAFYSAAMPAFIANAASDALGFWFLRLAKNQSLAIEKNPALHVLITMFCFGGAAAITLPLEVVVTHMRLEKINPKCTVLNGFKILYRSGGARALTRGLPASMFSHGLWGSIIAFEEIGRKLTPLNKEIRAPQ